MSASRKTGNTRDLLLQATLDVIADEGLRSATHREIVKRAGISLSATSYHFSSIDDMLYESISAYVYNAIERYGGWFDAISTRDDFIKAVSQLILEVQRNSVDATLLYELYAQAARSPRYRELVQEWSRNTLNKMQRFVDPDTVLRIAAYIDGFIFLRSISETAVTEEFIRQTLDDAVCASERLPERSSAAGAA